MRSLHVAILAIAFASTQSPAHADSIEIGDGTPSSCTEVAFVAGLATLGSNTAFSGGDLTFNCGPDPVTIPITSEKALSYGATAFPARIRGGNLITLDAGGGNRHFSITGTDTQVVLAELTLRGGSAPSGDYGGSVFLSAGATLTAQNSRFRNNSGGVGGGAIAGEPGSVLNVLGSSFDQNSANSGGAIAHTGTLTISNSRFSENFATDQGGALQWWFGTGTIANSDFNANQSTNYGGAVVLRGGTPRIEDSRLNGNIATTAGGALYAYEAAVVAVYRSTFAGNETAGSGGAVYLEGRLGPGGTDNKVLGTLAGFVDSTFELNRATADGGAIYVYGIRNEFDGVYAGVVLENSQVRGNTASKGGGLYLGGQARLTGSQIRDNVAAGAGGGLYLGFHGVLGNPRGQETILSSTRVQGNVASSDGGGLYVDRHGFEMSSVDFVENVATRDGGGAYVYPTANFLLTEHKFTSFVRNRARLGGGLATLHPRGTFVTLRHGTFSGNQLNDNGQTGRDVYASAGGGNGLLDIDPGVYLVNGTALNPQGLTGSALHAESGVDIGFHRSIVYGGSTVCGGAGRFRSEGLNALAAVCAAGPNDFEPTSLATLGLGTLSEGNNTYFHLPAANSPVVDFAACAAGETSDQRGLPRPQDGNYDGTTLCDIGAIERQPAEQPSGSLFVSGFEPSAASCSPMQLLADHSFEASLGASPPWNSTSTNFGTALCGAACGSPGPRLGAAWARFGGPGTAAETATVSQALIIPSGSQRFLNFFLRATQPGGVGARLEVSVDGTPLRTYTDPATTEASYTQRSLDLSAYADGAQHLIRFRYDTPAGANTMFNVDDVFIGCIAAPGATQ